MSLVTSSSLAGPFKVKSTEEIEPLGVVDIMGVFSQNGILWRGLRGGILEIGGDRGIARTGAKDVLLADGYSLFAEAVQVAEEVRNRFVRNVGVILYKPNVLKGKRDPYPVSMPPTILIVMLI